MIISQTHKFIFIHIMKAAGTSVTNDLSRHLDWRDLVLGSTPLGEAIHLSYKRYMGVEKHSRARDAIRLVGRDIWDDYFTFSFVRHPFPRTVSLYTYLQHHVGERKRGGLKGRALLALGRFKDTDWMSHLPEAKAFLQASGFSEFIRLAHEMRGQGMQPQVDWLTDETGKIAVDFIGKTENLQSDFARVLERLGFESAEPSWQNRTIKDKRAWPSYFAGQEDFDFLSKVFEKDFEILGYDPNEHMT